MINGTTTQGQTLSTSNGTRSGSPTGYSYQWKDCDSSGNNCINISGATSRSYTLASGDGNRQLWSNLLAGDPRHGRHAAVP